MGEERLETQECEIVPHEECKQIVDKIPKKVSKKVTKVVCDDKMNMENEPTNTLEDDDDVPSLQDILEIFGVNTNDNDVNIDDAFQSTTTTTTAIPTTTTTTTTKSTTRKSSTTERELIT